MATLKGKITNVFQKIVDIQGKCHSRIKFVTISTAKKKIK